MDAAVWWEFSAHESKAEPAPTLPVHSLSCNMKLLRGAAGNAEGLGFFPFCPCEQHIFFSGSLGNTLRVECGAIGWSGILSAAGLITRAGGSIHMTKVCGCRHSKTQILES